MSHDCQRTSEPCNEDDQETIGRTPVLDDQEHHGMGGFYGIAIGKTLMISGVAVALPCVALSLAGYGATGIVGGSWAAASQSTIGNVAAGSLFANIQSAGAMGLFIKGMYGGGAAAAAGATTKVLKGRDVFGDVWAVPCKEDETIGRAPALDDQVVHIGKGSCPFGNAIGKTLLISGVTVALPCAALSLAGYGTTGIVGGSWAAAWQSAIGNVAAGSLFAKIQSAGAMGLLAKGMYGGGAAAAAGVTTKVVKGRNVLGDVWASGRHWSTVTQSAIGDVAAGCHGATIQSARATWRFVKGICTGGAAAAAGVTTKVVKGSSVFGDIWTWSASTSSAIGTVATGCHGATIQSAGATWQFVKGLCTGGAAAAARVTTKVVKGSSILGDIWAVGGHWSTSTSSAIGNVATGCHSATIQSARATWQFVKGICTGGAAAGVAMKAMNGQNVFGGVWRWMTGKKP